MMRPGDEVRVRGLLFDMDGTLVDSEAVVAGMWRRWAARHGLDPEELMRVQHGRRSIETVRLYPHLGLDAEAEAVLLGAEELAELDGIVEVRGAGALLRRLPAGSWGVVTSAQRELALARIRAAGLPVPEVLVSADDVVAGKPHPEGYLAGARQLGLAPGDCLVLEDAPAGLAAGRAAGARVLALTTTLAAGALDAEHHLPDYASVSVRVENGMIVLRLDD